MKILLTNWHDSGNYSGEPWISRLEKYGVDYSMVIELPNENGLNYADKNLVFLFKEPKTILDLTVIGYGNCYSQDDNGGGLFYTKIKNAIPKEQFDCAVETLIPEYLQEVAKNVFGFDEDKPLWKRKEALEKFLVQNYSRFILQ